MEQQKLKFPGFPEKPVENYWQYPKIMDGFWHNLTPVEQKVLDYILRHTWGWQKNVDYISYSQLKNGIPNVDNGTGIKSDRTISKALQGLVSKNMITKISGKSKGLTNHYSLVLNGEGRQEVKRGSVRSKEVGYKGGSARSKDTINNVTINNKQYISKEIGKSKISPSYGNEDINYLIEKFQELTGLKKLDGSQKQNRQYCWLCLKKFGEKEKVEQLIKLAVKSDFHRVNLTSFKYIYYHAVKIVNEFKEKVENPTYVKIK